MASEIVSKPATKAYRANYDRVFKKVKRKSKPKRILSRDENIDWGECGR